jgi:hypothetical protein
VLQDTFAQVAAPIPSKLNAAILRCFVLQALAVRRQQTLGFAPLEA